MRFYAVLFVALATTGAMAQLSDDQASEEIRATIPLIRNTFIVDEFDAEGLRGRDIHLDPPSPWVLSMNTIGLSSIRYLRLWIWRRFAQ